jgi:hypothetical protein
MRLAYQLDGGLQTLCVDVEDGHLMSPQQYGGWCVFEVGLCKLLRNAP